MTPMVPNVSNAKQIINSAKRQLNGCQLRIPQTVLIPFYGIRFFGVARPLGRIDFFFLNFQSSFPAILCRLIPAKSRDSEWLHSSLSLERENWVLTFANKTTKSRDTKGRQPQRVFFVIDRSHRQGNELRLYKESNLVRCLGGKGSGRWLANTQSFRWRKRRVIRDGEGGIRDGSLL